MRPRSIVGGAIEMPFVLYSIASYLYIRTFLIVLMSSSCSSCSRRICSLSDALCRRSSNSASRCCSAASFSATVFSERSWSMTALFSNNRCFIFSLNTFTRHNTSRPTTCAAPSTVYELQRDIGRKSQLFPTPLHLTPPYGVAPGTIAISVTRLERGFNACKTPRCIGPISIYLQPFPSNSSLNSKNSPF